MAEIPDTGGGGGVTPPATGPTAGETQTRVNPSVEASRVDDALIAERRKNAMGVGAVGAAGAGCLGMALLPWAAVAVGICAAVVIIVLVKGCQGS